MKRLADCVVQSEVKQVRSPPLTCTTHIHQPHQPHQPRHHTRTHISKAEESLKQREAARGLEERWQQQLAREAADARKEMKALGEAVGEDIGAHVAAIRCGR